jgi:L-ascorbate metabolism protein UlaG (beta-lactamase superfamily)
VNWDRLPLRHRDDPGTQHDLNWARHGVDLPVGLEIQWLGTAGFRLTCASTTLLIDPYVSRAPLGAVARRRALPSRADLVDRLLPTADAVLVGHTHFDHAVDVGSVAARHRCPVYGSASAAHLMALQGLGDLAVEVDPHLSYEIGPFTVRFTPSRHSRLVLGLKVPYDGELTCDSLDRMGAGDYRCGQVWGITVEVAGITLYHQGSADLIDDQVRDHGVDVFLCGIAGRAYTLDFVPRVLTALDPALIVAHHHDDFFRPLEGEMGFSFNVNLGGFADDVGRAAPGLPVRTLDPLQAVSAGRN